MAAAGSSVSALTSTRGRRPMSTVWPAHRSPGMSRSRRRRDYRRLLLRRAKIGNEMSVSEGVKRWRLSASEERQTMEYCPAIAAVWYLCHQNQHCLHCAEQHDRPGVGSSGRHKPVSYRVAKETPQVRQLSLISRLSVTRPKVISSNPSSSSSTSITRIPPPPRNASTATAQCRLPIWSLGRCPTPL